MRSRVARGPPSRRPRVRVPAWVCCASQALHNRRAIANAGPFKMLVFQLKSDSTRVKMLAVAVMSKLSGDSKDNVNAIATAQGIRPLVAL